MGERIVIGADHAGFALKRQAVDKLVRLGYEPVDARPKMLDPQDAFPDFAKPVAEAVSAGTTPRGVLMCRSSRGMSSTANRQEILHTWRETAFEGGRHQRRVAKIDQ